MESKWLITLTDGSFANPFGHFSLIFFFFLHVSRFCFLRLFFSFTWRFYFSNTRLFPGFVLSVISFVFFFLCFSVYLLFYFIYLIFLIQLSFSWTKEKDWCKHIRSSVGTSRTGSCVKISFAHLARWGGMYWLNSVYFSTTKKQI